MAERVHSPFYPGMPESRMLYGPVQWRDKDGHVWDISDMADEHIENSMRMMIRNAASIYEDAVQSEIAFASSPIFPRGEIAQEDAHKAFEELIETDPKRYVTRHYPPYRTMAQVRRVRKLELRRAEREMRTRTPEWLMEITPPTARDIVDQLVENVDMHICSDCGGDERWKNDAIEVLINKFGLDRE